MGGNSGGAGALLGGTALAVATGGASLGIMAAHAAGGALVGGLAGEAIGGMLEAPEVPEPVKPDAPVESGDEGIRKGEMDRQSKRRALGQIHLTRGQNRADGATFGGSRETLG